jgi:hypothetical protein
VTPCATIADVTIERDGGGIAWSRNGRFEISLFEAAYRYEPLN